MYKLIDLFDNYTNTTFSNIMYGKFYFAKMMSNRIPDLVDVQTMSIINKISDYRYRSKSNMHILITKDTDVYRMDNLFVKPFWTIYSRFISYRYYSREARFIMRLK